jgi:hypothetical protein
MPQTKLTRRDITALAGGGAIAATLVGAATTPAVAYQGNMERAVSALYAALGSLRESTPNKGGHRERAMELVSQAISEVQAGIEFADEHGGGGPP